MTSRATEIQTLIADIDGLLANSGKRLSRSLFQKGNTGGNDGNPAPREVLERVRGLLVELESEDLPEGNLLEIQTQRSLQGGEVSSSPSSVPDLVSEIAAPLREEISTLLAERKKLIQEIHELEQQRLQNHSLAQQLAHQEQAISEFLQVLRNRVETELPLQSYRLDSDEIIPPPPELNINRDLVDLDGKPIDGQEGNFENLGLVAINRDGSVERVDRFTQELDRRLLALDGTVNVVFESLQRNIQTYYESLSQSLRRMHNTSTQGEEVLVNLINNLTQTQSQSAFLSIQDQAIQDQAVQNKGERGAVRDRKLAQPGRMEPSISPSVPAPSPVPVRDAGSPDSPVFAVNSDGEEVPDLDALLSELSQDMDTTPSPSSTQPKNSKNQPGNDAIDALYAGLFSNDANSIQNPHTAPTRLEESELRVSQPVNNLTPEPKTTINSPGENLQVGNSQLETNSQPENNLDSNITDAAVISSVDEIQLVFNQQELPPATTLNPLDRENHPEAIAIESVGSEFVVESINPETTAEVTQSEIKQPEIKQSEIKQSEIKPESTSIEAIPPVSQEKTNQDQKISRSAQDLYPAVTLDPNLVVKITPSPTSSLPSQTDPWFDDADAGLMANTISSTPEVTTETVKTEALKIEQAIATPGIEDTISLLTDLQIEGEATQTNSGQTNLLNRLSTGEKATPTPIPTPPPAKANKPLSPRENLIAQATASLDLDTIIPQISLDSEQQAQLHADLTAFEAQPSIPLPLQQVDFPENESPVEESSISQHPIEETPVADEIISNTNSDTSNSTEEINARETNFTVPDTTNPDTTNLEPTNLDISTFPTLDNITAKSGDTQILPLTEPEVISISQSSDGDDAQNAAADSEETVWYLGIDIGTTGISATLMNRTTTELYPIYWSAESGIDIDISKRTFRLPSEVYLPSNSTVNTAISENSAGNTKQQVSQFTAQLKPYLQVALAYRNDRNSWEPTLQLNEMATVSLAWIMRSLSKLFLTLKSDKQSTTIGLTAAAVGLPSEEFTEIIDNLSGVICNCPVNWSEQYRFNIREALLTAKLVSHPQEVFFVEEAIASLICELDGANGEEVYTHEEGGIKPTRNQDTPILGNTLAINLGASSTEMALVEVPENLLELAHSDFMLHSFAYGGKGIEQDIICQLLLPDKWRQSRLNKNQDNSNMASAPWHWQPTILGLEQTRLSSIKWEELSLPHPGEPDQPERINLQQRLETYPLGQALLDVASAIKLILQHQENFTFELADQRWLIHRRDLESQVFVPFVRRLNRELNRLLVARGIPTEAIDQVILTGGVANLTAVNRWLRQKLPNAQIIQEAYLSENNSPTCSRIAYGLSVLPLHPQILDIPRQQYTDYFLFTELLRVIPDHAIPFGEIINLFEAKGINTRTCQQRLLAFLEGELPAGFVPSSIDSLWLTNSSLESSEYRAITEKPLFEKQGSLSYRPNLEQIQALKRYLDVIQSSNQQSLEEPYTVNFALGIPIV